MNGQQHTYFLADGTTMVERLSIAKSLAKQQECLYIGESSLILGDLAPYLMSRSPELAELFFSEGWGKAWGMVVVSKHSFEWVYKHFRRFLLVKTEDGKELYFRFYDPRALRIFLPTCNLSQLREFFGPVDYFICEDEDPEFGTIFTLSSTQLLCKRMSKEEIEAQLHPLIKETD
jgi:hypothetical protein